MKYKNLKKKYLSLDLQLFAEAGEDDNIDSEDTGGDDQDDEESDEDGNDESDEKKYTEKEMEAAVQKRLEREKRKLKRAQKQRESSGNNASGKDGENDKETRELREKAAKADDLELKWTCLEHDVDKSYVEDVLALAKTRMARDEKLDIEDAIDEVLKKYPNFKVSSKRDDDDEGETKGRSWGQRQSGQRKKPSGVEAAFLKKNPGLKID